jgi:hypothetical protein
MATGVSNCPVLLVMGGYAYRLVGRGSATQASLIR